MTVNFYLNPNKKGSRELSIFCYVRGYGKTIILNTGQRIPKDNWDNIKQRAQDRGKGKFTGAPELNSYLNFFSDRVQSVLRDYQKHNPEATFEQIKLNLVEKIFPWKNQKQLTFFEVFDEYINLQQSVVEDSTVKKYRVIKNHLVRFQKASKYQISFDSMTMTFKDKFLFYLLNEKKMLDSTAYKMIKFVKSFLTWSNERGYHNNLEFKTWKGKSFSNNEIVTLTQDELDSLKRLNLEDRKLLRVRDLFLFQCYTGVRFGDLIKIRRENLRDDSWHIKTEKTSEIIDIPLSPDALNILDKYQEDYLPLPVISNQKTNEYLKDLCRLSSINDKIVISKSRNNKKEEKLFEKWQLIGTHTARRTFITLSLERGMRPEVIMKITGHKSYRTMQRYINITNKIVKNEFQKAWGTPLTLIFNQNKK